MAIITFAAEELTFEQRLGSDIRVSFDEDSTIEANSGEGKRFPGGPSCIFRGKTIPALITCSPKGSITSDILKSAFQRLDEMSIYQRTSTLRPFALFDAHDSRLQVPFLQYINKKENPWTFCIGLPNGTHKWQVGDSREQNGSWKVEWVREKAKLVLFRTRMGLDPELQKSDILPLYNRVWPKSFGQKKGNQKAIRDRGWCPLNRRLLTDPEVVKTKPLPTNNSNALVSTPESASNISTIQLLNTPPTTALVPTLLPSSNGSTISLSHISTPPAIPPPNSNPTSSSVISKHVNLADVNFDNGLAGEFAVDIIQQMVRKDKIRKNLNERYEKGREVRGIIDTTKRLTGGTMFKSDHIVLDEVILKYREEKEQQKVDQKEGIIRKAINEYNNRKLAYDAVISSNVVEEKYKGEQYKAIIHFKKRKADKAVPQRLADLKQRYHEIKGRDILTLRQFLTDRGMDNDEESKALIIRMLSPPRRLHEEMEVEAGLQEEVEVEAPGQSVEL